MGQTILCEIIAEWEEIGEQPDVKEFDFDSMLDVLKKAQEIMFDLGTSANECTRQLRMAKKALQQIADDPEANAQLARNALKDL